MSDGGEPMNAPQAAALQAIKRVHGIRCWVGEHKSHGSMTVMVYYDGFGFTINSNGSLDLYTNELTTLSTQSEHPNAS